MMRPTSSDRGGDRERGGERGGERGRGPAGAAGRPGGRPSRERSGGGRFLRKKICRLCAETTVDYKERDRILRYLTEKGKIIPRRTTGNCSRCQRRLVRAIKRARHAGIVAFQIAS